MKSNDDDGSDILHQVTQQLYDAVVDQYQRVEAEMGSTHAIATTITALATTMGTVLAQLPPSIRDQYMEISKQMLDETFAEALHKLAVQQWGQIGHA